MKAVAENLFNKLQDLCIWSSYRINDDGYLNLCTARQSNFKRINHAGCYKISQDSSLWMHGNFQRVVTYI